MDNLISSKIYRKGAFNQNIHPLTRCFLTIGLLFDEIISNFNRL